MDCCYYESTLFWTCEKLEDAELSIFDIKFSSLYHRRLFKESVAQFAQEHIAPHAEKIDKTNYFPEEVNLWKLMGDFNLHGITAPDLERLMLSAGPIGIMQSCLDVVLPYVRQREQFGRPIGEFQLMEGKIADMYTSLQSSRSYIYSVARQCDNGILVPKDCAGVILIAAERATQVALQAIQCLGGNGYVNEYPTGRMLRDAKLYEIGAGTSEIRRIIVGRELFKEQ
ncbi:isovaleryl-CoA dehydrogenase, mitochondrial [Tanacetum coccineum]